MAGGWGQGEIIYSSLSHKKTLNSYSKQLQRDVESVGVIGVVQDIGLNKLVILCVNLNDRFL